MACPAFVYVLSIFAQIVWSVSWVQVEVPVCYLRRCPRVGAHVWYGAHPDWQHVNAYVMVFCFTGL